MQLLTTKWNEEDIIVIGTGFSGLAAAIEAKDSGAGVVILEKMHTIGGNSIISGGCLNAVDPERQSPHGIEDSLGKHFQQTWAAGDCRCDPKRIRAVVNLGLETVHWLEKQGIEWQPKVYQGYGASWPRSHKAFNRGAGIIKALKHQVDKRGIPILLEHKVVKIIRERPLKGRVLGVEVRTKRGRIFFKGKKAIVNASGGFSANAKMVRKYDYRLKDLPVSGSKAATGELILLSQEIGADVIGMDHIQCNPRPYGFRTRRTHDRTRYSSRVLNIADLPYIIYVNYKGERIVSSDARRDVIRDAVLNQTEKSAFILCDDELRELKGISLEDAWKRVRDGKMFGGNTIKDLARNMGISSNTLEKTIAKFNFYVNKRHDPDFAQAKHMLLNKIETPPFWATMISMAIHYTCGGLRVGGANWTQVLDLRGKIIPGYYAAGETTGGFNGTNRVGCNAILECIVAGRWAGIAAANGR